MKTSLAITIAILSTILLSGCNGPGKGSRSVDILSFEDFQNAVPDLTNQMLGDTPHFQVEKAGNQKWYLRIGRITNNTGIQFPTRILSDDIANLLYKSKKILVLQAFTESSKETDFVLNATLSVLDESVGNQKKKVYYLQFQLTTTDGVQVFRGRSKPIRKKGKF